MFALVGGVYALWKFRSDRRVYAGDRARNAYAVFMRLALEYPEFFPGCWIGVRADPMRKNKFEWFIAHFLWASEDIIFHDPLDKYGYVDGIRDTIREHRDYFSSQDFAEKEARGYCVALQLLIERTVSEPHPERDGPVINVPGVKPQPPV